MNIYRRISEKIGSVRTVLMTVALSFLLFISPLTVSAQATAAPTDFKSLVRLVISVINMIIPVLITLGLLFFVYGLVRYVTAGGDADKLKEARNFILSGIVALFVIISIWGLVRVVVDSIFPGSYGIPQIK